MNTAITIRNLDEEVKQKLRVQAAQHGRSMEAEVRYILTSQVMVGDAVAEAPETSGHKEPTKQRFDHMVGIWKGRGTTDDLMRATRGED